jgi:EAL domain-containing protein (putative c-di-GMP-specific phosphodiesterase class I)
VIAEGIESYEMLHFVQHASEFDAMRNLAIEGGQGYLLGRPSVAMPAIRNLPDPVEPL